MGKKCEGKDQPAVNGNWWYDFYFCKIWNHHSQKKFS